MKKVFALVVMFSVVAMVSAVMAVEPGPETMTIDKIQKSMAPVAFPHKAHQDHMACVDCHHKTPEGEQPEACTVCHETIEGVPGLKDAMHNKCTACHKEMAAAGKPAPTKCTECHKK